MSRDPVPDPAEHNAYFPSEYSRSQAVSDRSNFDGAEGYSQPTGRRKVLMIGTDERYLMTANGRLFSTGNHPIETLLPLMHLKAAGYEIDVATPSGNMVKLELWAFPEQDDAVRAAHEDLLPKLNEPLSLTEVLADLGPDSDYAAVFIPGGHGALIDLPVRPEVGRVLDWALANDRFIITLCHGPAALLAAADADGPSPFAGYEICVFPDSQDEGANVENGYIPGHLTWLFGERLADQGLTLVNKDMTGQVHQDRKLLSGDGPPAANDLGRLAVEAMAKA